MDIAIIEPYFAGSHSQLIETLLSKENGKLVLFLNYVVLF